MWGPRAKFHFRNRRKHPRALGNGQLAKRAARSMSNVLLLVKVDRQEYLRTSHSQRELRQKGLFFPLIARYSPRAHRKRMFGYSEGGAFTGSKKGGNQGKFELSDGGTLCQMKSAKCLWSLQATCSAGSWISRISGSAAGCGSCRCPDLATTNRKLRKRSRREPPGGPFLQSQMSVLSRWSATCNA